MISNVTIGSMFFGIIFSFLLFAGLIVFFKKKQGVSVKPIIIGAIGFIVFTQILEKIMHVAVFSMLPDLAEHPWPFGIYGGLAAGTFEELGRFALYVWLLKKYRDYKDGVSFGIGWGGIEAVVLMLIGMLPNIMFSFMINAGTFESTMGAQLSAEQLGTLKDTLLTNGAGYYLLGALERFFAVFMQISFSILVLLGVVKKKFSYVLLSLLLHAVIDFPLAFYQSGVITELWVIEVYIGIIGLSSFIFIKKSRKWFA